MAGTRKNIVINQLKSFNRGLKKKTLDEKYTKMAATPFAFYRGTDHIFWADFCKDKRLKEFSSPRTKTWLQGDLHIYNYGTFDDDHGDLVYGLNDFDEGVIADYQYDLWRLAISIILTARANGKSKKSDEKKFITTLTDAYLKQLKKLVGSKLEDKINYTAKMTKPPLKTYMKMVDQKNAKVRKEMLKKWTKNGRFNTDSEKLAEVPAKIRQALVAAIEGDGKEKSPYRRSLRGGLAGAKDSYFTVIDVAERLGAGTGSLGTKRFYVLIEGKKAKAGDDTILDVKHQGSPCAFPYLSDEDRKYYSFDNDAHRTVEAYRALSIRTDDHLGWVKLPRLSNEIPAGYYSIRERSPEKEAYPALLSELKKSQKKLSLAKKSNIIAMCQQWGEILATSHARADNDANKARIPYSFEKNVTKITKSRKKEFGDLVCEVASQYANQVLEDYGYFLQWVGVKEKNAETTKSVRKR